MNGIGIDRWPEATEKESQIETDAKRERERKRRSEAERQREGNVVVGWRESAF